MHKQMFNLKEFIILKLKKWTNYQSQFLLQEVPYFK